MPAPRNLVGMKFGRLLVIGLSLVRRCEKRYWECACDCGKSTVVSGSNLGRCIFSCGCLNSELRRSRKTNLTHGMRYTVEYRAWRAMISRCTNPNVPAFKNYGGRGISVCERWMKFEHFYADVGAKPSANLDLDRINNDGNYEPGNVRWTTRSINIKNTRPRSRSPLGRFV